MQNVSFAHASPKKMRSVTSLVGIHEIDKKAMPDWLVPQCSIQGNIRVRKLFRYTLAGKTIKGKIIKGKAIDFKPQGPAAGYGSDKIQRKPGRFWQVKIY